MVDALALGASGATHGGSSPLLGTKTRPESDSFQVFGFCSQRRGLERRRRYTRRAKRGLVAEPRPAVLRLSESVAKRRMSERLSNCGTSPNFLAQKLRPRSTSFWVFGFCSHKTFAKSLICEIIIIIKN
ncbi:MAG: hypothetical protein UR79_C0002G0073 [Candidatus Campbellbacteria bacterium GW2011_GWD1_35_49]|nr:MAG: hypothetical protein UR74_C0002G0260 [Candidatus Campbellbacteria bacterium GW2011_GWD2_35_24]KKP75880.1 MAG: hypothetical protein UR75_C0002G0261 [Candidatus Campbellbacteria bacterium GW2011_GWC2_35_28]KKP76872.1 MAG: hypothetical protein UR76_C0002G0073 [Candidatus Campbellbacteria bacterium GW2011_GWC1_35_31]KKP78798.1 MAG: hypothetical protein UR79_C0002G0073 [Candidatus Campbellbacteria bacterium GW2011_GWD1_35_49]